MKRRLALVATASLALLLSGCQAITRSVPVAMPQQLIGNWQAVTEAGTKPFPVRFSAQGATFDLRCGVVSGPWQARPGGLLVIVPAGGAEACVRRGAPGLPAWFASTVSFRTQGAQRMLQDLNGQTLVTLTPDLRAESPDPQGVEVAPVVARPAFRVGLPPAQFGDLLGRWRDPTDQAGAEVAFRFDGSFIQDDGCDLQGGRWVAEHGSFLALAAGPTTLRGCTGGTDLLHDVVAMAKAGPRLVLFDRFGHQLRELWLDGDA